MVVVPTRCWKRLSSSRALVRSLASRLESGSSRRKTWWAPTTAPARATPAGPRRQVVDDLPVDEDLPLARLLQPGDGAQQGGLAAPRGAEEDEVFALLGGQVDAVHGVDPPTLELLDEPPDLHDLSHGRPPITCRRPGRAFATSRRSA